MRNFIRIPYLILAFLAMVLFVTGASAQTLDIYGGRTDITGTNTGKWHTQKVGKRWWIVDPLGNVLFYQSIGSWQGVGAGKYGTACQGAAQISIEVSSWGFNGFGQNDSNPNGLPMGPCSSTSGFVNLPHIDILETSLYSTAANFSVGSARQNFTPYASRPTKNLTMGLNSNSRKGYTPGLVDVFDGVYTIFVNALASDQVTPFGNNAYNFGILMDDTDFLNGFGGTSDFDTVPSGHNKTNLGYNVATTSPIQTWDGGNSGCCDGGPSTYTGINVFYSDPIVYTKGLMASPPTTCSTTTPCSYGTFLQKKYGTIAALNNVTTGWASNYTTFGSSGQCVGYTDATGSICGSGSGSASETVGTGNGATTLFTRTLTNTPVSIHSVQLVLNNADILTGDCPESGLGRCGVSSGGQFFAMVSPFTFSTSSNVLLGDSYLDSNGYRQIVTTAGMTGTSNPPAGGWTTTYNGTTTSGTAVFTNKGPLPITGPQPYIQDDPCTGSGSGFGAASFWAQIIYHGSPPIGTSSQIPSRQVGNTCMTVGQTVFITGPDGSNGGIGNPSWVTGYDVYMSCRNQSGGAANGCAAAGPTTAPPLTLQASNIPLAQITTISCTAGTVTVNTASADGFTVGDTINLFKTSGGFDLDHNNPVTVASTPLTTQFTYAQPGGGCPSASGSGGTVWKWFKLPNAPMASGAALPTPPSIVNYTTGLVQVTFSAPLQNTIPLTVNYVANGFGLGTGLMDEDGRNTAWMGFESVCLLPVANTGAGSTSWACRPGNGNYATPTMNQNTAADLMAYQTQYAAKYFSTMKTAINNASPGLLYLGTDTLGDWCTPPHKEILAGALPYLDILWTQWCADTTESTQRFNYFATARGDAPIMNFQTLCANLDSAAASFGSQVCLDSTQPARAQRWYDLINTELNTLTPNGSYQWVGASWWALRDYIPGENTNWGLKTVQDNAYDGSEAASGSIACSAPLAAFNCGNQPAPGGSAVRPFGNLIGGTFGVKAANALWLAIPSGGVPPTAATPTASPVAGTYTTAQAVTLSTTSPGAIICWNFNVGVPIVINGASTCPANSTLFTTPIAVPITETIHAVAGGVGFSDSIVSTFPYVINTAQPPPAGGSIPPLIIITKGCQYVQPDSSSTQSQICKDAGAVPCLVCM